MRIAVIGGGPGGLYFATLMKKAHVSHDIHVVERNRADDTFGFGVVFSDATMAGIIGVKAIDIRDQVIPDRFGKEIDHGHLDGARFLLDRLVERPNALDGHIRIRLAAEPWQRCQIRKVGHHDGAGDFVLHPVQDEPEVLLKPLGTVPTNQIIGARPERHQVRFSPDLCCRSHRFLDQINSGTGDAEIQQGDAGKSLVQFGLDQEDITFRQGKGAHSCCIACPECQVDERDRLFLRGLDAPKGTKKPGDAQKDCGET